MRKLFLGKVYDTFELQYEILNTFFHNEPFGDKVNNLVAEFESFEDFINNLHLYKIKTLYINTSVFQMLQDNPKDISYNDSINIKINIFCQDRNMEDMKNMCINGILKYFPNFSKINTNVFLKNNQFIPYKTKVMNEDRIYVNRKNYEYCDGKYILKSKIYEQLTKPCRD